MAKYVDVEKVYEQATNGFHSDFGRSMADLTSLKEVLEDTPAADVAEVRHARWDKNGRCTLCGGHAPFWCMASTYYKSPYCFECGAKMDGVPDNNVGKMDGNGVRKKVITALENLEYYDVVNENCESIEVELIADAVFEVIADYLKGGADNDQ